MIVKERCEGEAFVRLPYSISAVFSLQYAQQETQQTSFILLYNSLVFFLLLWPPPTNTFVFLGRGWPRCFRPFDRTGLLVRGSFYFFDESEINLDWGEACFFLDKDRMTEDEAERFLYWGRLFLFGLQIIFQLLPLSCFVKCSVAEHVHGMRLFESSGDWSSAVWCVPLPLLPIGHSHLPLSKLGNEGLQKGPNWGFHQTGPGGSRPIRCWWVISIEGRRNQIPSLVRKRLVI